MTGLLIVNKPLTWTSMDVIRKVRRVTRIKKVGHAGTLDPLATGVLLVCIGREATREIDYLMAEQKEYITTIDLTAFSETDDAEGTLIPVEVVTPPTKDVILSVLKKFIGKQQQTPPKYSALKVNGKRAYKLARTNQEVTMKQRPIIIHNIALISYEWPLLTIRINCGKGTYIRSLGRDIGASLKTGGYLTKLTRTASGNYTIERAFDIANVTEITEEMLIPVAEFSKK